MHSRHHGGCGWWQGVQDIPPRDSVEGVPPAPSPPRRPSYKAASQVGTLPRHPTVVSPVPR